LLFILVSTKLSALFNIQLTIVVRNKATMPVKINDTCQWVWLIIRVSWNSFVLAFDFIIVVSLLPHLVLAKDVHEIGISLLIHIIRVVTEDSLDDALLGISFTFYCVSEFEGVFGASVEQLLAAVLDVF